MRRYFHDERQTVGWMPPMLYQNAICLIRRQLKRHGKFTLLRFRYIGCAFLIQPGDWEGIYSLLFDLRHSPTPCRSFLSGYSSIVCCQRLQPEFSHKQSMKWVLEMHSLNFKDSHRSLKQNQEL